MGCIDVDAMLASMSAKQFMGWVHYFAAENGDVDSDGRLLKGLGRKQSPKEIECILRTKYGKSN